MKRETTPTLPVKIGMVYEDDSIENISFIFKQSARSDAPAVLYKSFSEGEIPFGETGDTYFIVNIPLTFEETRKLPPGKIYMDTRIALRGGTIPETEIVSLFVNETLFNEEEAG